jgi:AcrR family transcriptional regulator
MIANKSTILLDAALACFVECGFHGTTTADVAARAGVGPGTLFRTFASKEILMEAACKYAVAQLAAQLTIEENAARPGERLHDLLARWWKLTAEAVLENSIAFRYWCLHRATPHPTAADTHLSQLGPFADVPKLLERALRQAPWLTTNALPLEVIAPLLAGQWMAVMEVVLASAANRENTALQVELLSRAYTNWWITLGLPSHTLVTGNVPPLTLPAKPASGIDALIKKYVPNFKND